MRLTLAALLVLAPPAFAQPAAPAPGTARPYVVKGFRSALFGMDEAAVRAAAAKDLGVAPASLETFANKAEGTTVLTARVPSLSPGVGGAAVSYILGATSRRLTHVNVVWLVPGNASVEDRAAETAAGLRLAEYFRGYSWSPNATANNVPLGASSAIMFIGEAAGGGAVQVRADGVSFTRPGQPSGAPTVTGPVALTVSYDQNAAKPDVSHLADGQF